VGVSAHGPASQMTLASALPTGLASRHSLKTPPATTGHFQRRHGLSPDSNKIRPADHDDHTAARTGASPARGTPGPPRMPSQPATGTDADERNVARNRPGDSVSCGTGQYGHAQFKSPRARGHRRDPRLRPSHRQTGRADHAHPSGCGRSARAVTGPWMSCSPNGVGYAAYGSCRLGVALRTSAGSTRQAGCA
jgi:hypothetical protein